MSVGYASLTKPGLIGQHMDSLGAVCLTYMGVNAKSADGPVTTSTMIFTATLE